MQVSDQNNKKLKCEKKNYHYMRMDNKYARNNK